MEGVVVKVGVRKKENQSRKRVYQEVEVYLRRPSRPVGPSTAPAEPK